MASKPILRGNYYYTFDRVSGKGKWVKLSKDKAESKILLRQYENNKDRGRFGLPLLTEGVLWVDVVKRYDDYISSWKRPNSLLRDRSSIVAFSAWSKITHLNQYNQEVLESYMKYLSSRLIASSINRYFSTLKGLGKKIEEWYGIENPSRCLIYIKEDENEVRYLSNEEVDLIKTHIETNESPWLKTAFMLGLHGGLREGEACHLKWKNINFDEKTFQVTPKPEVDWKPKTKECRSVPMNSMLYNELYRIKEEDKPQNEDWVIEKDGGRVPEGAICASFVRICRLSGVFGASFHTLRKTCATRLQGLGMPPTDLMAFFGHKSLKTVLKYWGKSSETQKNIVNKMNFGEEKKPELAIAK